MGKKKKATLSINDPMSPSTSKVDQNEAEYLGTAIEMLDRMRAGGKYGEIEKSPIISVDGECLGPGMSPMLSAAGISVKKDTINTHAVKSVKLIVETGDIAVLHIEYYEVDVKGDIMPDRIKIRSYPIKKVHIETGGLGFGYA